MDHRILQTQHAHALQLTASNKNGSKKTQGNFKDILADVKTVQISKHAKQRINERQILINDHEWQEIAVKMAEAKQKGVTDSLVITNDAALVVNTKKNMVVTAMNQDEAQSKIFTNINGTILIHNQAGPLGEAK